MKSSLSLDQGRGTLGSGSFTTGIPSHNRNNSLKGLNSKADPGTVLDWSSPWLAA